MKNRELDKLIATEIMGYTKNTNDKYGEYPFISPDGTEVCADFLSAPDHMKLPSFSTNVNSALEAAEKIGLFQEFFLAKLHENWVIYEPIGVDVDLYAEAETLPMVICLASLKFIGKEYA